MKFIYYFLSLLALGGLFIPMVQGQLHWADEPVLHGWVPPSKPFPNSVIDGWFDRRLQEWVTAEAEANLGFRPILVKGFNEATLTLFSNTRNNGHIIVDGNKLYAEQAVGYLHGSLISRKKFEVELSPIARDAAITQELLRRKGVNLLIVLAASKPQVEPFPLGSQYLKYKSDPFKEMYRWGESLAAEGVNHIDFGEYFRQHAKELGRPLYADGGWHWNYYAGCIATQKIIERIELNTGSNLINLDCEDVTMKPAASTDLDGANLVNTWSLDRFLAKQPYPVPKQVKTGGEIIPAIAHIGDSFGWPLWVLLRDYKIFLRSSYFSYFGWREITDFTDNPAAKKGPQVNVTKDNISEILEDLYTHDTIILQMAYYNIPRDGYGFFKTIIENLLPEYSWGGKIDFNEGGNASSFSLDGWGPALANGMATTGPRSRLAFRAQSNNKNILLQAKVTGDVSAGGPRDVQVRINGKVRSTWRFAVDDGKWHEMSIKIPAAFVRTPNVVIEFKTLNGEPLALRFDHLSLRPSQ